MWALAGGQREKTRGKRDPKSNDWLKNLSLKGFTAQNIKTALKTKANVVPVKEALTRGRAYKVQEMRWTFGNAAPCDGRLQEGIQEHDCETKQAV